VRAAVEDDERETAGEGLAERRVAAAGGSADADGALEYFFGFLRAELAAGDVALVSSHSKRNGPLTHLGVSTK